MDATWGSMSLSNTTTCWLMGFPKCMCFFICELMLLHSAAMHFLFSSSSPFKLSQCLNRCFDVILTMCVLGVYVHVGCIWACWLHMLCVVGYVCACVDMIIVSGYLFRHWIRLNDEIVCTIPVQGSMGQLNLHLSVSTLHHRKHGGKAASLGGVCLRASRNIHHLHSLIQQHGHAHVQ